MFAIGNEELSRLPLLPDTIKCYMCGKEHPIEYGKRKLDDGTWEESKNLAFYVCGDVSYLAGIEGMDIRRS